MSNNADCKTLVQTKAGDSQTLLRGTYGVRITPNSRPEETYCCPAQENKPQLHRSIQGHGIRSCNGIHDRNGVQNLQFVEQCLRRIWKGRADSLFMMPLPHKHGDSNPLETIANVLTSVPFIFIGLRAPREKVVTKLYANSIIGVGLASSLYHTSRGDARKIFRWGDYAMISTSALCLTRALRSENQRALIIASALLLPIKPSFVTAIHTGLTEATFYWRVRADPALRNAHTMHAASLLVGCALFLADGMLPDTPFIHAAWHLAAAVGVATYNKLLE